MTRLNDKFAKGETLTFTTSTRVHEDIPKEEAVETTVIVDLEGVTVQDVIGNSNGLSVKRQGAYRTSFDSQETFRAWAEKQSFEDYVHYNEIGRKIVSAEQRKAQIKSGFKTTAMTKEEKLALIQEMQQELEND